MRGLKHARILLVDADPAAREGLAHVLQQAGFDRAGLMWADSAEEARERLAEGPADLVLASFRLGPGETGAELLAAARAHWPGAARVLLTSFDDLERAGEALQAGVAQALVRKPWDDVLLLCEVQGALRARIADERRLLMVERALGMAGMLRQQRAGPTRDVPTLQAALGVRPRDE